MRKIIFLTGATGFLGANILFETLRYNPQKIYVLLRARNLKEAHKKLLHIYNSYSRYYDEESKSKFFEIIVPILGDISQKQLGINGKQRCMLLERVETIYHSAALCSFDITLKTARIINVKGTKETLEFGYGCFKYGNLDSFNHISTVGIVGNRRGKFFEKNVYVGQKFNNFYEKSKFEAEKVVCFYRKRGMIVNVFRPSLIVGNSIDGYTTNFKMFYEPLRFFSKEIFDSIPASKKTHYNFVPVDYCAKVIVAISMNFPGGNQNYHILGTGDFRFKFIIDTASVFFKFKKPKFISLNKFNTKRITPVQHKILKSFIPYFNYAPDFDQSNTLRILKILGIANFKTDRSFFIKLLTFCKNIGFIRELKK